MCNWILAASLLLTLVSVEAGAAQSDADSLRAWTRRLSSGALEQRVDAAASLHAAGPADLPAEAQAALVSELDRINDLLMSGTEVPGADELGGESFGEHYLDLALSVASFDTPAATCALVRSVGVGGGIQRRVASQGDPVVGELAEMIHQDYQAGEALETLALAWFWADSTGAPLSAGSRGVIAREIVSASGSSDYTLVRGSASTLELLADPAFLPLARGLRERALAANQRLVAGALERGAIPRLAAAARAMSVPDLSIRVQRAGAAACADAFSGPRRGVCAATQQELEAARAHLQAGRSGPARNVLQAVVRRVEQAARMGVLQPGEADLLGGGAQMLLERI